LEGFKVDIIRIISEQRGMLGVRLRELKKLVGLG
jgi:hypothetical protein